MCTKDLFLVSENYFKVVLIKAGYTNVSLSAYYTPVSINSIEAIFRQYAIMLQDYQGLPKIINFAKREEQISVILCNYDISHFLNTYKDPDALYDAFSKAFSLVIKAKNRNNDSWVKYSKGLFEAAYVLKNCSFESFQTELANCNQSNDPDKMIAFAKRFCVKGLQFAGICNFMKECGAEQFIKPDSHLLDAMAALGKCKDNNTHINVLKGKAKEQNLLDCFKAGFELAKENSVTPFALDRIIWLCCSGTLFKNEAAGVTKDITLNTNKEEYLKTIATLK